jgi:hypothetical protein
MILVALLVSLPPSLLPQFPDTPPLLAVAATHIFMHQRKKNERKRERELNDLK